jgi:hypothetical protein
LALGVKQIAALWGCNLPLIKLPQITSSTASELEQNSAACRLRLIHSCQLGVDAINPSDPKALQLINGWPRLSQRSRNAFKSET